jgi:hypothetical protein
MLDDTHLLHDAVHHHSCANVIHPESGFKVDRFVKRIGPYEDVCLQHHVARRLAPGDRTFPAATAVDILLRKLGDLLTRAVAAIRDGG